MMRREDSFEYVNDLLAPFNSTDANLANEMDEVLGEISCYKCKY